MPPVQRANPGAARERFGIPAERLYINIDRVGNTVGALVPLCLDEVTLAGKIRPGMKVMFLAFGGGSDLGLEPLADVSAVESGEQRIESSVSPLLPVGFATGRSTRAAVRRGG